MKEVKRMYEHATADALLQAARELFGRFDYDGTSVRAITNQAGVNLGAITYHFGSKRTLYEAVITAAIGPSRERLAAAAAQPGTALDRIEEIVRAFFEFLDENPDLPHFMFQQFIGSQPIPEAARHMLDANFVLISSLIAGGQADGSIRPGDARLMALSVVAQPIYLTLAQRILRDVLEVDQSEPEIRQRLVEVAVSFVRAGLSTGSERV
jgi:AcrR family transcriptional regulator